MVPARELAPIVALHGARQLVVGQEIGRGTQGTVHIARLEQPSADRSELMARNVAVKVLDPALHRDAETMAELLRSVRRAMLVRHPNVVGITDYFVASACPCIVCDLVDGMSLAGFLSRWQRANRRLPLDLALFIAAEIAEGLAGARSTANINGAIMNIVHHNLTPRQVLLSWHGEVKVSDFGWRPSAGMTSGVRRSDRDVYAQIAYMAPEVARGARGDGRSDVFSLGVILHEMLYGPRFPRSQHPDLMRDAVDLVRAGVVKRPVIAPIFPTKIIDIVDRALEVDARERQPHAGVLAYDLRREALALGVGDGRMFLRNSLFEMSEGVESDDTLSPSEA